jgi:hypothetical protein
MTLDQTFGLHDLEPVGEQVRRDPGQATLEIAVSTRPQRQQLPDDEQHPPIPDDVQRAGHRAVLPVALHAPTLSPSVET